MGVIKVIEYEGNTYLCNQETNFAVQVFPDFNIGFCFERISIEEWNRIIYMINKGEKK